MLRLNEQAVKKMIDDKIIQIQPMLRLNIFFIFGIVTSSINSNTTNVKVKRHLLIGRSIATHYSNTTNVKVKPVNYSITTTRKCIQIQPMLRLNVVLC